jgi:putative glycosyltransferase (TIGR04372 family)
MNYVRLYSLAKWWFIKTDKKNYHQIFVDMLLRILSIILFPIIWVLLFIILPSKKIKFIFLYRERLGHLIGNTDQFIRKTINDPSDNTKYVVFCHNPANATVVELFSRIIPVVNNEYLFKIMSTFGVFENRFCQKIPADSYNHVRLRVSTPYFFTDHEISSGKKLINEMGLREQDWYVTFHARDNAFDDNISGTNASYNKMASYRNTDINLYESAATLIAQNGGRAIRVGFPVEGRLKLKENLLFDYSLSEFRCDFADVWLCANSRFMVVTANGAAELAAMFDVPIVMVNVVPIGAYPFARNSIYLPKVLSNKSGEPLSFSDQLRYFAKIELAANSFVMDSINSDGLMLRENSGTEIAEATSEMLARLSGKWQPRSGYHDRIAMLTECYQEYGGFGVPPVPMGEDFLFTLYF